MRIDVNCAFLDDPKIYKVIREFNSISFTLQVALKNIVPSKCLISSEETRTNCTVQRNPSVLGSLCKVVNVEC